MDAFFSKLFSCYLFGLFCALSIFSRAIFTVHFDPFKTIDGKSLGKSWKLFTNSWKNVLHLDKIIWSFYWILTGPLNICRLVCPAEIVNRPDGLPIRCVTREPNEPIFSTNTSRLTSYESVNEYLILRKLGQEQRNSPHKKWKCILFIRNVLNINGWNLKPKIRIKKVKKVCKNKYKLKKLQSYPKYT